VNVSFFLVFLSEHARCAVAFGLSLQQQQQQQQATFKINSR